MATSKLNLNPPHGDIFQNPTPFQPFPATPLRSGNIKKLWGKEIESAIYKVPLSGPVEITVMGISTDQHAYPPHISPDKALLHYGTGHYALWKQELPNSAHLFNPGAFGENLHSEEVDERTICIGDKISIGEVLLEVSENRAPCYKLNHRFEIKDAAKRSQTRFRTGWLYRVLKTGTVRPGDMVTLIERPHPDWTVARLMHYLYNEKDNAERMKEIVQLKELGESIKKLFRRRLENGKIEDMDARMIGDQNCVMDSWNEYRIVEKRRETSKVTAFVLEATEEIENPVPVEPGSHIRIKLGGKLVRAYSVVGGTSKKFELGIALDPESRGGSKFLHHQTKVGDILTAGSITASFPLSKDADRHIIIAGGIGITAFLAALEVLRESNANYELHFPVANEVPFLSRITPLGSNATIYNKSRGQKFHVKNVLSRADENTHIYCCGPQRLMDGVEAAAKEYGIPESSVHFEQFAVSTSGDPFTAELRESKKTVEVGENQTLLDVLRQVGMDIDSSCEAGNCGTCRVSVCSGRIEHRGTGLLDIEKADAMLSCVSRGIGRIVLEL
jgi:MOSC domain-containing protein YiiM/ferredoxin-NADP reductase